jgi:NAD(P)-dependent dehydrogenase (short-subunit alcohol dehydrogenase family)
MSHVFGPSRVDFRKCTFKKQKQPYQRYRIRPMAALEPNILSHSQNVGSRWMYSFQAPLTDPKTSFEGKNVIVTGANTGLGLEAAIKFTALHASQVILGVRDFTKGNHAKSFIEDLTDKKDKVEVWKLDMDSYDSIQEFAKRASSLDHLDVVVLNAGVYMVNYQESKYGWEKTLQVNVLSTALLGLLLLPKLKSSKNGTFLPVLEFVSSSNHQKVSFSQEQQSADSLLEAYNKATGFTASQQYAASKLFLMYVMQSLASFAYSPNTTTGSPEAVVTSVCPRLLQVGPQQRTQYICYECPQIHRQCTLSTDY